VLTGAEVAALDDESLEAALPGTTVFARITPEQKSRIIKVARHAGKDVGFLGDAVNDAVALPLSQRLERIGSRRSIGVGGLGPCRDPCFGHVRPRCRQRHSIAADGARGPAPRAPSEPVPGQDLAIGIFLAGSCLGSGILIPRVPAL
jgi:hypothetical protein